MHVQQHQLRHIVGIGNSQCIMRAPGVGDLAAPALQQGAGGSAGLWVIVDVPGHTPLQGGIVLAVCDGAGAHGRLRGFYVAQRNLDPEHTAFAKGGAQPNLVAQQFAQTLHNRQPQACAAIIGVAFVKTAKFFKNLALQALGNAGPLVMHFDAHMVARTAAADQDAPLARVTNGVGDKVLQDAAQQRLITAHDKVAGAGAQLQPLAFGQHAKVVVHHMQERVERKVPHVHLKLAGLHAGNVQQAVQDGIL